MTLKSGILDLACDDNECGSIARPNSSTSRRRSRGLLLRKGVWHIDKVIYGKRICESTGTGDLVEAEALLAHRASEARRLHHYGRTFREAESGSSRRVGICAA